MKKFNVGDWVYASDWCYGCITEIEDGFAVVEFDTDFGGGNCSFMLKDLKKAETPDKSRIVFEEAYESELYQTTTLYFRGPKSLLKDEYVDAEFSTISVEFPNNNREAKSCMVTISPAKYDEEKGEYIDYDWFDYSIPYDEIKKLLELFKYEEKENGQKVYKM